MKFNRLSFFRLPIIMPLIACFIFFHNIYAQDATTKIDQNDLREYIQTLSSIQFEGRSVDNNGQIKTQDFIIERFKTLQLEPYSSEGYLEKFNLNMTDKREVYLKTRKGQKLLNFNRMVCTDDVQPINQIDYELVFGGNGSAQELDQIEVENRLVLVYLENANDEFALKQRLEARNAKGLIIFFEDDFRFERMKRQYNDVHYRKKFSLADFSPGTIDFELEPIEIFGLFPTLHYFVIPETEVKNVMGVSKSKLIKITHKKKIKKVPIAKISIHYEQANKTLETANVIGIIRGESEKSIIISAHYDHVGTEDDRYYPGADDNASGVAALLELAEEYKQYEKPRYTMVFLAFSSEEGGLLGSYYHVNYTDFDSEKALCNINMDMISRCDNRHTDCNYLYCVIDKHSETLNNLVREVDKLFPDCACNYTQYDSNFFERTDTYNFSKKGIPSVLFFAGFHDDYHKSTDTVEKIDFDLLENRVLLINKIIKQIQSTSQVISKGQQ